jgi:four helix bundle protein
LAEELKDRVFKILERPPVTKDTDFCWQIRKSARAAPAMIAEGFGRFRHKEFARYVEMANGVVHETRNHLRDGAERGHLTVDEFRERWRLCYRHDRFG